MQLSIRARGAPHHTPASPTPNTHSRAHSLSPRADFGVHVGLVVRSEAGVDGVVLRVDLRSPIEAQSVSPRTQSERHNHTAPAREPGRLATLRRYGAERRAFVSLRRRAHRAPILPRARPSQPLDGLSGSPSRSFKSRPSDPTIDVRSHGESRPAMHASNCGCAARGPARWAAVAPSKAALSGSSRVKAVHCLRNGGGSDGLWKVDS